MEQLKEIVRNIKNKTIAPVYFLMGDEPYYIDNVADYIESNVLTEEEKGFNQMILYGRDVTIQDIVSNAKRFPLMADKQVIIVKEAQELAKTIEQLDDYVNQPQPSTVLVFCYKYKTIDKRKKLYKSLQKKAVLFESNRLKEYKLEGWLQQTVSKRGYSIDPKSAAMLIEFLGNDLSKIVKELDKLALVLPKGQPITAEVIEKNIGISKDYNNFELMKAIVDRNQFHAYKIANHFAQNPRNNPFVVTIGIVYAYFSKLLLYHGLQDKSPQNVMRNLKIVQYAIKDYELGFKTYPMKRVSQIIAHLKEVDLKGKGVGASQLPQGDLLKEMLIKIFN
ncbi:MULTISPECIES: DNA polymerase III subunit delta [unclassified Myroides]|uniref:DNA polymerase III subunit delta n=1 Tax=unclassified Myroides TaxID=2642485 RepID=UPI003D2F55A0